MHLGFPLGVTPCPPLHTGQIPPSLNLFPFFRDILAGFVSMSVIMDRLFKTQVNKHAGFAY